MGRHILYHNDFSFWIMNAGQDRSSCRNGSMVLTLLAFSVLMVPLVEVQPLVVLLETNMIWSKKPTWLLKFLETFEDAEFRWWVMCPVLGCYPLWFLKKMLHHESIQASGNRNLSSEEIHFNVAFRIQKCSRMAALERYLIQGPLWRAQSVPHAVRIIINFVESNFLNIPFCRSI